MFNQTLLAKQGWHLLNGGNLLHTVSYKPSISLRRAS